MDAAEAEMRISDVWYGDSMLEIFLTRAGSQVVVVCRDEVAR